MWQFEEALTFCCEMWKQVETVGNIILMRNVQSTTALMKHGERSTGAKST